MRISPLPNLALVRGRVRKQKNRTLTNADFLVWGLLRGEFIRGNAIVQMAYSSWVFAAGLSKRQVFRSLAALQSAGIIDRKAQWMTLDEPRDVFYSARRGWVAVRNLQIATKVWLTSYGLMFTARSRSKRQSSRQPKREAPQRSFSQRSSPQTRRRGQTLEQPSDELSVVLDAAWAAWASHKPD